MQIIFSRAPFCIPAYNGVNQVPGICGCKGQKCRCSYKCKNKRWQYKIMFGELDILVWLQMSWDKLLFSHSVGHHLCPTAAKFEDRWWPLQTVWIQMRPHKMWGLICDPNCLTHRLYIRKKLDENEEFLHWRKQWFFAILGRKQNKNIT